MKLEVFGAILKKKVASEKSGVILCPQIKQGRCVTSELEPFGPVDKMFDACKCKFEKSK